MKKDVNKMVVLTRIVEPERAKKEVIEFFMEVEPGLINDERVKDTLLFYSSKNHNLDF